MQVGCSSCSLLQINGLGPWLQNQALVTQIPPASSFSSAAFEHQFDPVQFGPCRLPEPQAAEAGGVSGPA